MTKVLAKNTTHSFQARNDWNGTEEMLQANVRNALYDRVQALLQGAWLIDPRYTRARYHKNEYSIYSRAAES